MTFLQADAARLPFADGAFDLVLGSPPYGEARTYGINAQRKCQAWIDWMLQVTAEAVRVSKGLVIWICTGWTKKWCYQPGCEGLLYEWWKQGGRCWRPAFWHRDGIPGGGGKQWLRPNVEYAMCFTKCLKGIPWSDNTANGHTPKWAPGGESSNRTVDGKRVNSRDQFGGTGKGAGKGSRKANGKRENGERPGRRVAVGHKPDGDTKFADAYHPPVLANPGCLIKDIKVGGGLMGHKLAHENEAPYPQKLAEWFIRGWAPPGGRVFDPFSGSGSTVAAAATLGRRGVGADLRLSQCELGRRRCAEIQPIIF